MAATLVNSTARVLAVLTVVIASLVGHVDAAVHVHGLTEQRPIGGSDDAAGGLGTLPSPPPQRYTSRLNFSSSAPHLFASAYGLLQQWSNTVFPNGHALATATIPAYTLLYHGLRAEDQDPDPDTLAPPSPEWLAFDLEMAYGIMGSTRCSWLLTYQTTRTVRVLYLDGESAALMGLGQLDSQMLLLYGNVSGPSRREGRNGGGFGGLTDEYDRARGMCDWLQQQGLRGRGWGYEGIVRMNAGFEVIWCDFLSDSLRLLSRLNVTAPLNPVEEGEEEEEDDDDKGEMHKAEQSYYTLPPIPTRSDRAVEPTNPLPPPNWRGGKGGDGRYGGPGGLPGDGDSSREVGEEPFLASQAWGWFESATWHYGASRAGPGAGETRVRVDNCGILSYYAPRFDDSALARARAEDERQRLNLTAGGHWSASAAVDRTVALRQLARRRRFHHLGNASVDDALLMRRSTQEALERTLLQEQDHGREHGTACSGAPWTLILAEIVQRMARHLKTVEAILLEGPTSATGTDTSTEAKSGDARRWLHELRSQNHMFMVGYLEYPTMDNSDTNAAEAWQPGTALFNRTLSLCRYRYTRLFAGEHGDSSQIMSRRLPQEEDDLRWAVEETYGTLCAELLAIGFDVEHTWAKRYGAGAEKKGKEKHSQGKRAHDWEGLSVAAAQWYEQLTELIAWLGWESEFIGCDRVCGWNERCFIPMWPLMGSLWGRGDGPPGRGGGSRRPPYGRGPRGNDTDSNDPWPWPPYNGSYGGGGGWPGFRIPRSPAMMGDDTDLWEPKCVEAWYIRGRW